MKKQEESKNKGVEESWKKWDVQKKEYQGYVLCCDPIPYTNRRRHFQFLFSHLHSGIMYTFVHLPQQFSFFSLTDNSSLTTCLHTFKNIPGIFQRMFQLTKYHEFITHSQKLRPKSTLAHQVLGHILSAVKIVHIHTTYTISTYTRPCKLIHKSTKIGRDPEQPADQYIIPYPSLFYYLSH